MKMRRTAERNQIVQKPVQWTFFFFVLLSLRVLFERTVVNQTQVKVTSLPQATQIYLSVTALAGGATAETATISSYSGD